MEYIYTTDSAAAKNTAPSDLIPTPIEVTVETDTASIRIKGTCGLQVNDTLEKALRKTNSSRSSGNGEVILWGLSIAFWLGLVVFFSSAFFELGRKSPEPVQPRLGRVP